MRGWFDVVTDRKRKQRKSLATNRARARQMRREPVSTEDLFWSCVRNRQLGGHKFRRQVLIGPFIVDFVCIEKELIVELDGPLHAARIGYDRARDEFLREQGFDILRYRNEELAPNIASALNAIRHLLDTTAPSPRPLPHSVGEGETVSSIAEIDLVRSAP